MVTLPTRLEPTRSAHTLALTRWLQLDNPKHCIGSDYIFIRLVHQLCVVAQANGIPAYAVVPTRCVLPPPPVPCLTSRRFGGGGGGASTIDLDVATGDDIVIEERGADEVLLSPQRHYQGGNAPQR